MSDVLDAPPRGGTAKSAAEFRAALDEIGESQAGLVRLMIGHGDDRSPETIRRHLQRMASGEARLSGEMRVVLDFLRRGRRKAAEAAAAFDWVRREDGAITTTTSDGWVILLLPQSRGRWCVLVRHLASGFEVSFPRWQDTSDAAQSVAMATLDQGRREREAIVRDRLREFTSSPA